MKRGITPLHIETHFEKNAFEMKNAFEV